MCKMSTGVVVLFVASLVGVACGGQPSLTSGEGSGGNAGGAKGGQAGGAVDNGTASGSGGTAGAGGVGAGETSEAGGGTSGMGGCPLIACPAFGCVGETHLDPDPCGCPVCGPAPDSGVAKDATPPTACPMLASLNSTDAAHVGYSAARALFDCTYTGGGSICVSNDVTGCSGSRAVIGDLVSCSNLCAADEYGLAYGGVGPLAAPPSIDLPAGCGSGMFTPGGVAFYCCPCGM